MSSYVVIDTKYLDEGASFFELLSMDLTSAECSIASYSVVDILLSMYYMMCKLRYDAKYVSMALVNSSEVRMFVDSINDTFELLRKHYDINIHDSNRGLICLPDSIISVEFDY